MDADASAGSLSQQLWTGKEPTQTGAVHRPGYEETACGACGENEEGVEQAGGVEGESRQQKLSSHGEDRVEEVDGEGIASHVARPSVETLGYHVAYGTHATKEAQRVDNGGNVTPEAVIGPQGKHDEWYPCCSRGTYEAQQLSVEQSDGYAQYIIESVACGQQGGEEAHCDGHANQQEKGRKGAYAPFEAECEPVEQCACDHSVQKPVGAYTGDAERAQQCGGG